MTGTEEDHLPPAPSVPLSISSKKESCAAPQPSWGLGLFSRLLANLRVEFSGELGVQRRRPSSVWGRWGGARGRCKGGGVKTFFRIFRVNTLGNVTWILVRKAYELIIYSPHPRKVGERVPPPSPPYFPHLPFGLRHSNPLYTAALRRSPEVPGIRFRCFGPLRFMAHSSVRTMAACRFAYVIIHISLSNSM